jgi:ferritin-like metal-binding protein YciE
MGLMSTKLNSLDDLFVQQLEDLYDAEQRLVDAIPKMTEATKNERLAQAFRDHHGETQGHVKRLERVFGMLGKDPKRGTCPAMKGLIEEAENMVKAKGDEATRDAALIAAAQRVEHYEIAGYGTARSLARQIGRDDAAELLQQTLDEEAAADKLLTQVAEESVNAAGRQR